VTSNFKPTNPSSAAHIYFWLCFDLLL
jgi:hypothetical protein